MQKRLEDTMKPTVLSAWCKHKDNPNTEKSEEIYTQGLFVSDIVYTNNYL